jgi:primase-polymerase (primpol)-like protein
MTARTDAEAAYFTLLRAIDERDSLLREKEYLHAELARVDGFADEVREREAELPHPPTRAVTATTKPLMEALGARRTAVAHALERIDERINAAETFVLECEAEHHRLRSG